MVGHTALGAWQNPPIPPPSLHGGEGSSFAGLVPPDDMVNSESVVSIKPGDSGVVIGYQVDEFNHTWSLGWFVAHSHIYPWFTGKVSSLPHFPMEPGCQDYSFLDQAVADLEHGIDSILTDMIKTPELDTSLDQPDAVTSSVSCEFLHSVSTISETSKLQLVSSIRSHKLLCQARALLAPVPLATKILTSKLICYLSSHPTAFGFWSSTPPDNITLTPANRKADQSLSEFQTGIGAAAHTTVNRSRSFLASELPLLILFPLYQILRYELYLSQKWVNYLPRLTFCTMLCPKSIENSAHILVHVFNSTSKQPHKVLATQFPFHHSLNDVVSLGEACLYGHINWSLAQAQKQSSIGLSQSFPPREVAKPGQGLGSLCLCKRGMCQSLLVPL